MGWYLKARILSQTKSPEISLQNLLLLWMSCSFSAVWLSTASQNTSQNWLEAVAWLWVSYPTWHFMLSQFLHVYSILCLVRNMSEKIVNKDEDKEPAVFWHDFISSAHTCVLFKLHMYTQKTCSLSWHMLKLLFCLAQLMYFKVAFPCLELHYTGKKKILLFLQISVEHGSPGYLYSTILFYSTRYWFLETVCFIPVCEKKQLSLPCL